MLLIERHQSSISESSGHSVLTLRVDCLTLLAVRRVGVVAIRWHLAVLLRVDHTTRLLRCVLALVRTICSLVPNGRKRRSASILLVTGLLHVLSVRWLAVDLLSLLSGCLALALVLGLTSLLLLLLASLPLLADFLEFWGALVVTGALMLEDETSLG